MKKNLCLFTLLWSSLGVCGDLVFEPPVIIDPPNPQAGDMVRVGLFVEFFPPCLLLPRENSIGETHSLIVDQSNIELDVLAITDPQCNPVP